MRVSVCLVTRNHAECVAAALRSAADVAAEAVVIDTGSTDDTVEVARRAGAVVEPFAWDDDFAAACNAFLDRATGDWVLWMNPDETVEPAAVPPLAGAVGDSAAFAFAVGVVQQPRGDSKQVGPAEPQVRLFRRLPGVRFRGRLHPAFDPPVRELAAGRNMAVRPLGTVLRRHAYLSPVTPDKVRWAVRLLDAELRDRPGQLHYQIELGANLLRLDDPRGHAVMAEAADRVFAAAADAVPPCPQVAVLLEYLLAKPAAAAAARPLADRWFAASPPVLWAAAQACVAAGDDEAAVDRLHRLVELGRSGRFDRSLPFDTAILGPAAALALGDCFRRLNRPADAVAWLTPLADHPTYSARARQLLAAISPGTPPA